MKKILFTTLLCLSIIRCFGQSYLGSINKIVNLRTGPGIDYEILKSLKPGTQIFIVSLTLDNDFYNIIDIKTNQEGFVKKSFVKLIKEIKLNEPGMFTPNGSSSDYNPEIEIYNNTNKILSLKLNEEMYHFNFQEKRTITLSPGSYYYRASAAGVIPNIGNEEIKGNMKYTWQFYIIKRYR